MPVDVEHRRAPIASRVVPALPGVILLVGFGFLALTRFHALESAMGSGRAILLLVGFLAVWLVASRLVLPRLIRAAWVRSALLSVVSVVVLVLVVLPYYRDHEVIERFPTAAPAAETSTPADEPAPAPAEPVRVSSGELQGIDHSATGTASVFRRPDGSLVVELEDIDIESGPDYFVHVVPGTDREDPDGGADLGKLHGNQGTQYYEVPAGTEPGTDWTVLVWCRAFAVPVANATQDAV